MKYIESEDPKHHWGMLNVKDKRVLDLGCGRMWEGFPTTPEYFLAQGASKVLGIEMSPSEEKWYGENVKDERLRVVTDRIEKSATLKAYFEVFKPDVVKMDIEGSELLLTVLFPQDLITIQEMAIEYHSSRIKKELSLNAKRLGFKEIHFYTLTGFDPEDQGVIHLKK